MTFPTPSSETIPALLGELAQRFGEREAFVAGERRLTYRQLRQEVMRTAAGLAALGVRRGDPVGILMGNRMEWVLAFLALQQLGATSVGLNTWSTPRELEHALSHAEVRLLVAVDRFRRSDWRAILAALRPAGNLPHLARTVWVAADPGQAPVLDAGQGETSWEAMLAGVTPAGLEAAEAAGRRVEPGDVGMLLYTSGSTALPKGILLQHRQWIRNGFHIGERQHNTEQDRLWLAVSLFWSFGCVNALPNLLTHGGCVVLQEHFDPKEALRLIEAERCSVLYATPNIVQALHEHPDRPARDLTSLRSGAIIGTPEQIRLAVDLGAHAICNVYGLSETYGNCAVIDAGEPLDLRLRSVGEPLPDVTVRICHLETGAPLPAGEVGEIRVQGPLFLAYHREPEKTRESYDADGYFRTGDLGLLDAQGRLYYKGRLKEMVKSGGINIAPAEVEEVLMRHPAVRTAYVIGVPHPTLDEALVAIIVPEGGAAPSGEELRALCAREMAAYKVPQRFHFTSESQLPLTTTGKVQKMMLHTLLP
ncbi:class I adenylate-forming enzyme family protein [Ramlibacter sp. MAHUQ-53]|uniref:class I adenylate-forming enzyme family protein n=1 Tax=unclassified Ramlibacter TaxID=2617605 RepID=UPI0036436D3C